MTTGELELVLNNLEIGLFNLLDEKIRDGDVDSIIFGPKNKSEDFEECSFFRLIFEDADVKSNGKMYISSQPIRITSNVNNNDIEYAKQESIRLNSWVADKIFKDKEFKNMDIVSDVSLTNILTAYPLEKAKPNQISSGIRIIVDLDLVFQCETV